jgi:exo-beta-1,3-glucanase (GH17 family)
MVNAFAFWQGASRDDATRVYLNDMFEAITHIEKVAGGADKKPEVWYVTTSTSTNLVHILTNALGTEKPDGPPP